MASNKALSAKDMNGLRIENLGAPDSVDDAARKQDTDDAYNNARSRTNHTGSQLANTVSDFDAQVRTSRLDQMAAPTAAVSLNSQKITNLASPAAASNDAVRMVDVEAAVAGLVSGQTLKGAVRVATTTNVNLAAPGAALDGVTMSNGDLFLATSQTTGSQNGPYVFNGAASAAIRATNWDASGEAVLGSYWIVREGTKADSFALLSNDSAITLGTTTPTFIFIAASAGGTAPGRFEVDSPAVSAGATWTVTHNLNTRDVIVAVRRVASPYDFVEVYTAATTVNTVSVIPDIAMSSGEYRCLVRY